MSEHDGYPGAPPGWYPDPAGGPGQRWWDGYAWSEATVLPQQPPPPPWASAPPPQAPASQVAPWAVASQRLADHNAAGLVDTETRMVGIGRFAIATPAVCAILTLIIARLNADRWLAVGHQFRVDWDAAQNHVTPPPYHGPSAITPANVLIGLLSIAGFIVMLVWQHRAASAGRALGIHSDESPGWGVGSWFVPVVNLWVPFLAVRDCLPAGDPHRERVLWWWLARIAASILGGTAAICALFSSGAALAVSIPAVVAYLAVIAWAPGIVTAIGVSHRAAVEGQA
jgi:hypothetical protein